MIGFTIIRKTLRPWDYWCRRTKGDSLTNMRREWTIEDDNRPWTANAERTWHRHKRANVVKQWRTRWYYLALNAKLPHLDKVSVTCIPLAKDRRWRPDVGACYPAVKAAIDGIVDAGVLDDDNPEHLLHVTFYPVQVVGRDGLRLTVREVE